MTNCTINQSRSGDTAPRLTPDERLYRVAADVGGLNLFLRHLEPRVRDANASPKVVLYIHGGTFPSALSIAHRFDGRSWRDELCATGFDVWGLDFLGFGASDPYPEMAEPAERHTALGQAAAASRQIEHAVRFIRTHHNVPRISIIAHSWGSIAAGRFAGTHPDFVDRLVFFGPVTWRSPNAEPQRYPAWRLVSLDDQWKRFTDDVPAGEPPVLARRHFDEWANATSTPAERAAHVPRQREDTQRAVAGHRRCMVGQTGLRSCLDPRSRRHHSGRMGQPGNRRRPSWLFDALRASPLRRDVKIARATHLMHLEENRYALYREAETFLRGDDMPTSA